MKVKQKKSLKYFAAMFSGTCVCMSSRTCACLLLLAAFLPHFVTAAAAVLRFLLTIHYSRSRKKKESPFFLLIFGQTRWKHANAKSSFFFGEPLQKEADILYDKLWKEEVKLWQQEPACTFDCLRALKIRRSTFLNYAKVWFRGYELVKCSVRNCKAVEKGILGFT